ncbi:hypothetical protein phiK7A1_170 [Pseudomonas phage phiK7A1]|uniref:Uncharacterized protein n=1 Tax=Pseudomonas phage phiK7A1 TaxID=2759194 RepID=A0A7H0XG18_9CAUD|nr:hypothetical protein phiK7A1_170 [Pseudomonas phage phiK7A1]
MTAETKLYDVWLGNVFLGRVEAVTGREAIEAVRRKDDKASPSQAYDAIEIVRK